MSGYCLFFVWGGIDKFNAVRVDYVSNVLCQQYPRPEQHVWCASLKKQNTYAHQLLRIWCHVTEQSASAMGK